MAPRHTVCTHATWSAQMCTDRHPGCLAKAEAKASDKKAIFLEKHTKVIF